MNKAMSTLVIGKNSFIAQHLKSNPKSKDWDYISYKNALNASEWDKKPNCVINLAIDSVVKEGKYSDIDLQIGLKAQNIGAHFIALSSRAVYGIADGLQNFTEESPFLEKCTPYGQGKRLIEEKLTNELDKSKLTILRPSNIFGFEYNADKPRNSFFGQMLYDLKNSGGINFEMSGETQKDFLPVDSFVNILVEIAQKPKAGIFNVGSGTATLCKDIAKWVMEGYGSVGLEVSNNGAYCDNFILDISKLQSEYPNLNSPINIKNKCYKVGKLLKDS